MEPEMIWIPDAVDIKPEPNIMTIKEEHIYESSGNNYEETTIKVEPNTSSFMSNLKEIKNEQSCAPTIKDECYTALEVEGLTKFEEGPSDPIQVDEEILLGYPSEIADELSAHSKEQNLHISEPVLFQSNNESDEIQNNGMKDPQTWCNICNASFKKLKIHMNKIHTRCPPYACLVCYESFPELDSLQRHMLTHPDQPYKCHICKRPYKYEFNLEKHMLKHAANPSFTCEICNKSFATRQGFRGHKITHTDDRPFACELCDKTFKIRGALRTHMLTHTGEQSYPCEFCNQSFIQHANLRLHMLNHSGERPYTCTICEKSFTNPVSLRVHMKVHTVRTRYTCEFCYKVYKTAASFTKHVGRHKGIHRYRRAHRCQVCDRVFKRFPEFKSHMLTHTDQQAQICVSDVLQSEEKT